MNRRWIVDALGDATLFRRLATESYLLGRLQIRAGVLLVELARAD